MNIDTNSIRLYINLTNHCDANCPFCCMYSESTKHTFMSIKTFEDIIKSHNKPFELQLEGGEPMLHPLIYEFIHLAIKTNRCKKVIILTNGLSLDKHIKKLKKCCQNYKLPFLIKISYNYWLESCDKKLLIKIKNWIRNYEDEYFSFLINCRLRHEDEKIKNELLKTKLESHANIFYLQSYGKNKNTDYEKPIIIQNIGDWFVYACDGKKFDKDLIARSEYESTLD